MQPSAQINFRKHQCSAGTYPLLPVRRIREISDIAIFTLLGFFGLSFFFYQGLSMDPSARDSLVSSAVSGLQPDDAGRPSRVVDESFLKIR